MSKSFLTLLKLVLYPNSQVQSKNFKKVLCHYRPSSLIDGEQLQVACAPLDDHMYLADGHTLVSEILALLPPPLN